MDKTIYWCYNETFGFYHDVPLAGKRAENFVNRKNECKGGHWVLHTPEQHKAWYEAKGRHLDNLRYENGR